MKVLMMKIITWATVYDSVSKSLLRRLGVCIPTAWDEMTIVHNF